MPTTAPVVSPLMVWSAEPHNERTTMLPAVPAIAMNPLGTS